MVGLNECVLRTIKHDSEQRMCPKEVEKQIERDKEVMNYIFSLPTAKGTATPPPPPTMTGPHVIRVTACPK